MSRTVKGMSVLSVDFEMLTHLLQLPPGHTIERVNIQDFPYAPGILVTVRGPACVDHPYRGPLYVEPIEEFFEAFPERIAARKREAQL